MKLNLRFCDFCKTSLTFRIHEDVDEYMEQENYIKYNNLRFPSESEENLELCDDCHREVINFIDDLRLKKINNTNNFLKKLSAFELIYTKKEDLNWSWECPYCKKINESNEDDVFNNAVFCKFCDKTII